MIVPKSIATGGLLGECHNPNNTIFSLYSLISNGSSAILAKTLSKENR